MTVGRFWNADFHSWPTGASVDHFDVQLLSGHGAGEAGAPSAELEGSAGRRVALPVVCTPTLRTLEVADPPEDDQ